jgi:hypothetical protein
MTEKAEKAVGIADMDKWRKALVIVVDVVGTDVATSGVKSKLRWNEEGGGQWDWGLVSRARWSWWYAIFAYSSIIWPTRMPKANRTRLGTWAASRVHTLQFGRRRTWRRPLMCWCHWWSYWIAGE